MSKYPKATKGFTLVELALTIAIVAILAAFGLMAFQGNTETRDAGMVQSAQASLQSIISQGSARMDVSPSELVSQNSGAVLSAIQSTVGQSGTQNMGVRFSFSGGRYIMNIANTGRSASYIVQPNGDVVLDTLSNFTKYRKDPVNGTIQKI